MSADRHFRTRADMVAAGMTLDEQNEALLEKLAVLKTQLEAAKVKARTTGDFSDSEWFNRTSHALRMTGREHQQVIREIGDRNKAARREQGNRLERKFVEIARSRLDGELFASLMDDAQSASQESA